VAIADEYRFFHWHVEFPSVFATPEESGFDVMLGNPPWERIKIQQEEWFAERAPEIAEARNAAERKRLIQELRTTRPYLFDEFVAEQRRASGEAALLTNSSRYPLCGRGDVNTYSVFAELITTLLSPGGMAGIVVPPGILSDDGNKTFSRELAHKKVLPRFFAFTNRWEHVP